MRTSITINRAQLEELVKNHVEFILNRAIPDNAVIRFQTKSKQNYKAEWEEADFRFFLEFELKS